MSYREAWASSIETQQNAKREVLLFLIAIFATRIMYDVLTNQIPLIKKVPTQKSGMNRYSFHVLVSAYGYICFIH